MTVRKSSRPEDSIGNCYLIEFPRINDPSGNLTFIEEGRHVPFEIRRVFYVSDTPSGGNRGGHAHKTLEEVIICLAGGVTVYLDDAYHRERRGLNLPWVGLYIPPMIWISVGNFDPGTVYMVLASDFHNERDYYRSYGEFLQAVRG